MAMGWRSWRGGWSAARGGWGGEGAAASGCRKADRPGAEWRATWEWRWPFCVAPADDWRQPCRRWMARARNKRNARSQARARNWSGWRHESERNSKPLMLSQAQRTAILELSAKQVSQHEIARVLQLSRLSVRKGLRSNSTQVPVIQRAEKAEPDRQQILEL